MQSNTGLDGVAADVIRPFSQADAKAAAAILKDAAASEPSIARLLANGGTMPPFLIAALSLSPYLADTARLFPSLLSSAVTDAFAPALDALITRARNAWRPSSGDPAGRGAVPSETELMAELRRLKRAFGFLVALADLGRVLSARETTGWLSAFAEACIAAAIDHLMLAAHQSGKLRLADPDVPCRGSGLVVLGMGKLGGKELNYSSDIDIVVFYDPDCGSLPDPLDASETYGRMMRRLIRILQDRTADGYVFRTDLRLRPDPGSTPLAVSIDAALIYYEGRGQNWERAAYIKARPVAGDLAAGEDFLRQMVPFVFRKYLDYAAIADIHSIKRQIHVHKGHGAIAVKGHDVKLGRGGIREIEFFVQTQQLIAGGRMPALRSRQTEVALQQLAQAGWITPAIATELGEAYWFLRDVEHRIQMVRDEQSHRLPDSESELKRIALMMGHADTRSFSSALEGVLRSVEKRYARLFEQEATLAGTAAASREDQAGSRRQRGSKGTAAGLHRDGTGGNLVFTGQNDDPDTLKTLATLGFQRPADMSRIIRTWHSGRYRATQSVEARERLTEMMPALLTAFGESRRADEVLLRFDGFLKALPAGIQLFSLIGNNPRLLSLLVMIMASAPRLAEIIAAKPHVFDGMLDPALLTELPTRAYLAERLAGFLAGARHYEDRLDRLRIFAAEQKFLIGVRLLTGAIGGAEAGRAFTHLADLLIEAALAAVIDEMKTTHGAYPGARLAVLGMGKLGSYELTASSDVDLILLYDYDEAALESDGAKPLDQQRYFTRLTQRLIAALSAPTAEGVVFDVDMRLRPSGNKGPVATRINAFAKYQRDEAWTWEHMALTRARLVCGDESLQAQARAVIAEVLATPADPHKILADVAEMRALIETEKPARDIWDFKLMAGGLVDIEFIAQSLRLVAPARGLVPPGHATDTAGTLKALGADLLAPSDLDTCLAALALFTDLSQIIRLCLDSAFAPADAPAGLIERLCAAAECPDIRTVEGEVKRLSKAVRKVFASLCRTR